MIGRKVFIKTGIFSLSPGLGTINGDQVYSYPDGYSTPSYLDGFEYTGCPILYRVVEEVFDPMVSKTQYRCVPVGGGDDVITYNTDMIFYD